MTASLEDLHERLSNLEDVVLQLIHSLSPLGDDNQRFLSFKLRQKFKKKI